MLSKAVKVGRSFHQLQKFGPETLQLCPSFRRHKLSKVTASENFVTSCIGFLIPTKDTSMSTLKPISCGQGFHSSANLSSINVNGESESLNAETSGCDNSCSTNVQATPEIERKYVHRVYDAIAPHFSATRFAKWPKVAGFLNSLSPDSVVLDAGCGNGKYLGFNPNCFFIGCDISPSLIDICAGRGHEVLVADAVNLPYRSNFGDAAISIAVLHHLSTESRRRKAIEELIRVVHKGGLVLITVWAVEQEDQALLTKWTPLLHKYNEGWVSPSSPRMRNSSTISLERILETDVDCHHSANLSRDEHDQLCHDEKGLEDKPTVATSAFSSMRERSASSNGKAETNQEYFVPWHLPYHRAEISGASAAALANGLARKDDKKGAMVYNRYYHVFAEGELERLVTGIENAAILEQFYDKSNWCIVLEKI